RMTSLPVPRRGAAGLEAPVSTTAAGVAVLLVLAAGLAGALYRYPPPLIVVLAAGLALVGVLALALARYEAAVALGVALLAAVKVEPAPPDAVFGVVMAVALVTGRFDLRRVPLTVGGLVGVFLALNLISAVEAVDPGRAALFFTITLYLAVFSLWFSGYLTGVRRTRQVVVAYVGAAVASAALASSAILLDYPGDEIFLEHGDLRAAALFADPNVFGPFLVPAALILLEETLQTRLLRWPRLVKVACFLILALGVVFSYSRAAWGHLVFAIVVMLAALALRRRGGGRALKVLAVAVLAAGVAATAVITSGSVEFLEQRAAIQSYDAERFEAQRFGIEAGESHPFGIGPGQFEIVAPAAAHSTYLRALGEQGMLGFAVISALFLFTTVLALRNAVLGRDTYGIGSAALLGAWSGIMLNSFVVDTLHWRHLWLVAALIWIASMRPAASPPRGRAGRGVPQAMRSPAGAGGVGR
ncbi:MAG: O-antigen ligase family protein, partial [Actinomycetota bacterium]|nr:O-antigen ligase family protein [Actinomycetota bacterium]